MNTPLKYKIKWSSRFKKEYKLAIKRGYDISLLDEVILQECNFETSTK